MRLTGSPPLWEHDQVGVAVRHHCFQRDRNVRFDVERHRNLRHDSPNDHGLTLLRFTHARPHGVFEPTIM
jgi:hypothetical protein